LNHWLITAPAQVFPEHKYLIVETLRQVIVVGFTPDEHRMYT
jgi:hypothetical protein